MSANKIYFTPGPSALYFTVEGHIKKALSENIPSISHRSKAFEGIFKEATSNLRELLTIPESHHIFFTGSATEVWERAIQNCVAEESFHLVNGAFSARFAKIAENLGVRVSKNKVPEGQCVAINELLVPETTELIAITHNETSTGATQPTEDIANIRSAFPDKIIAVDAVSSIPYAPLDFNFIDMGYFSVQKCFGLPAGLGVWIVNDRCIEKAQQLLNQQKSIGSYHSLPELAAKSKKNQTPETPNVLYIYLLAKVAKDMLDKGITQIRRETDYKAAVLYNMIEQHPKLATFVGHKPFQSKTTIVASIEKGVASDFLMPLEKKGFVLGSGYGAFKEQHIRIANFPTHSKEQIEMLADMIMEI